MEEARRRAHQRRLRYTAIGAGALLLGVAALLAVGHGSRVAEPPHSRPAPARHAGHLSLQRQPYIGVSCGAPNSIACDRIGLAIWLKRPAARLTATISGRRVTMSLPCVGSRNGRPCATYCREPSVRQEQPCGTYFEGFLRPAGLLNGPLKVQPDKGRYHWIGRHPPVGVVHIIARYRNGDTARTELRVPLSAGWG